MRQTTQGVSLQAILDQVFAGEARQGDAGCPSGNSGSVAVPATRTSEDRSRVRQMVLEELARRKQARDDSTATATEPKIASESCDAHIEPCLFAGGASVSNEGPCGAQPLNGVRAPGYGAGPQTDVRALVATAYRSLMRRLPEDHVILNPIANAEFVVRCRELGATVSEVVLNRTLLNNRKSKRHSDILRESVAGLETGVYDHIGHAVEIAASLVQRKWFAIGRDLPSVDEILCTPELRDAFKTYVTALYQGADIVNCHLVLLAYRKSGRESAQRLASVDVPDPLFTAPLRSVDPDDVPESCGIYRLLCKRKAIFVSGTANLRRRILSHFANHSGEVLPEGLPFSVDGSVSVQVFAGPSGWLPRRAEAVARSMRIGEYPELNWREKGVLFTDRSRIVARCAAFG